MKKILMLFSLIVTISALFAGCDIVSKSVQNLKFKNELHFELNDSETEYTVTFIGRKTGPEVTIPEEYNGLPVTGIADCAFYNCRRLKSITIPSSITHIGSNAFLGCSRLENVCISDVAAWCNIEFDYDWISFESNPFCYADNLYVNGEHITELIIPDNATRVSPMAFYDCKSLTSVTIPNGIIGEYAFYCCSGLKNITIGENVTAIETFAFESCTALEKIYFNAISMKDLVGIIDNGVDTLDNYAFASAGKDGDGIDVTIGKNVTRIPSRLFRSTDISKIKSVTFEEGGVCESIGEYAFDGCIYLESARISDSVKTLGSYVFNGCHNLTDLTLGDGISKIERGAFEGCSGITNITIPNRLNEIPGHIFDGCTGLTTINIPSGVTKISADAFEGCTGITSFNVDENNEKFKSEDGNIYFKHGRYLVKYAIGKPATEFTVPDGVVQIGIYAFSGSENLTSVIIPDSVTEIGNYAFYNCSALTNVTIGKNVTKIDTFAFANCKQLKEITIPDSVTFLGNNVFAGCTKLKRIVIPDSVSTIGTFAFLGCDKLTIRCEAEKKPDGWDRQWNPDRRRVVWGYTDK